MSEILLPQIACIFTHRDGGTVISFEIIGLIAGAVMMVAICWQLFDMWTSRTRGQSWPTVPAVIDVVSVAYFEDNALAINGLSRPYYQATLTYFFNNPEQQTGEYSRRFGKKNDAEDWANSYKGGTVKVHVDPRDPTRSVLREEDL